VAEHFEAGADDVLFARVDKGRQLGVGDRVGEVVVLVYEQNGLHTKQAISLLLSLISVHSCHFKKQLVSSVHLNEQA
jgi:hypothetical protein